MNPEVDNFLKKAKRWTEEMKSLRAILLDAGLSEELKWMKPCYGYNENNVAIIQPFKEQCAVMFFKGVLLSDPENLLESPGPNSRIAKRMMFSSLADVAEKKTRLRDFIAQAIEIEKSGRKPETEQASEPLPEELRSAFDEVEGLQTAFEALTPGRRRAYILHFCGAKQSATRRSRIDKCVPRILDGKGPRD